MKTYAPLLIVLLLVSTSYMGVSYNFEKSSTILYDGNTFYVGGNGEGNYTKIQDAFDNASDGDTIFVYNGTYAESLIVNKSIYLIGQCKEMTILQGKKDQQSPVVVLGASNVVLRGFTITSEWSYKGIYIYSDNNVVEDNIIKNMCEDGIIIYFASGNIISRNIVTNCFHLIRIIAGCFNTITGNILKYPCDLNVKIGFNSFNNVISGNHITGDKIINGLAILGSHQNLISRNNFIDCHIIFIASILNRWKGNYYSRLINIGPKVIFGGTFFVIPFGPNPIDWGIGFFPRFNFDWRPARKPYDIEV